MTTSKHPQVMTTPQLASRIADIFINARIYHWTGDELNAALRKIDNELDHRTAAGRRRYPVHMVTYVHGYADAMREDLWRNHVEFVYREPGSTVLYSTWRQSSHRSVDVLHARNQATAQWYALECAYVWRGTDKSFTPFTAGAASVG